MDEAAERALHWRDIWAHRKPGEVTWFERRPEVSLELIARCGPSSLDAVIDVGGGASTLAAALVACGQADVTVLDIAPEALAAAREEAGSEAWRIAWIVADLLSWRPQRRYALWHDRAVFHFLTEPADRARYRAVLEAALAPGGCAIFATFAPDGPDRCSSLPVQRHDEASILEWLGPGWDIVESRRQAHRTPGGAPQRFAWTALRMKLS